MDSQELYAKTTFDPSIVSLLDFVEFDQQSKGRLHEVVVDTEALGVFAGAFHYALFLTLVGRREAVLA